MEAELAGPRAAADGGCSTTGEARSAAMAAAAAAAAAAKRSRPRSTGKSELLALARPADGDDQSRGETELDELDELDEEKEFEEAGVDGAGSSKAPPLRAAVVLGWSSSSAIVAKDAE